MVRSGRRHKIGKAHILAVMQTVAPVVVDDTLVYVGPDDRGIELEIVAVPDDKRPDGLAVIHAMPTALREKKKEEDR